MSANIIYVRNCFALNVKEIISWALGFEMEFSDSVKLPYIVADLLLNLKGSIP